MLLVDDHAFILVILEEYCKFLGITSAKANNGREAVESTVENGCEVCEGFELIIMDLNMPVMNGIEATEAIMDLKKEGKVNPRLRVVAFTGQHDCRELCENAGMVDFIVKGISQSDFIDVIARIKY